MSDTKFIQLPLLNKTKLVDTIETLKVDLLKNEREMEDILKVRIGNTLRVWKITIRCLGGIKGFLTLCTKDGFSNRSTLEHLKP